MILGLTRTVLSALRVFVNDGAKHLSAKVFLFTSHNAQLLDARQGHEAIGWQVGRAEAPVAAMHRLRNNVGRCVVAGNVATGCVRLSRVAVARGFVLHFDRARLC